MPNKNDRLTLRRDIDMANFVKEAKNMSMIEIPISNGKVLLIKDKLISYDRDGRKKYVFTSKSDSNIRVTLVQVPKTGIWELTRQVGVSFSEELTKA